MVPWVRRQVVAGVVLACALAVASAFVAVHASGQDTDRCERFAAGAGARAAVVTGAGERVVVIGDSWSAGLGLRRLADSWPSRLPGSVHVSGFSGSGFSEQASPCGRVSFADRAPAAVRDGADLVVVEGGLNDVDQSDAAIRSGFDRLVRALRQRGADRIVVVGPASAPRRAARVPRVDALLRTLAARHDVAYVATSALRLPYLPDRLHLTPAGHDAFGQYVAAQLTALGD